MIEKWSDKLKKNSPIYKDKMNEKKLTLQKTFNSKQNKQTTLYIYTKWQKNAKTLFYT